MTDQPQAVPQSREAEEAALGCVLIDAEKYYDMSTVIKASDFYIHRHMWIWMAFTSLAKSGMDIDLITVSEELDRAGHLQECGGPAYITSLINQVPSSLNAMSYASIIQGASLRRKYITIANQIAVAAYDDKTAIENIPALIRDSIETVEQRDNAFVHISKPLSGIYDDIESAEANPREVWGLPTGLHKFDVSTGGICHKQLVWLVGEPGVGKSWSLSQFALAFAGVEPGAMVSMEMSTESIVRRMVSGLSTIRIKSMRSGIGLPYNWRELFGETSSVLENLPIYISDKTMTTDYLRSVLKVLKREFNIGWFGVDYALLFDDHAENEIVRTERISRNLKHICNDLDMAGVVLQSVVKSGMDMGTDGRGSKSSMRGSGQMIHDADMIMHLTPFQKLDDTDESIREEERKRMVTLWTTKGRDLERLPVEHLIRRDNSPFFDEFDADKVRSARPKQPEPVYREQD